MGSPGSRKAALEARVERLRLLRSAWGALAPSGLSAEKQTIGEVGRSLSDDLQRLLAAESGDGDGAALSALDARLSELEQELRDLALKVPLAQLRSTLPERLAVDRRGLLDLLDLMLGAEVAGLDGIRARIPVLDYLITLLCTGGDAEAALQDPVTLTPRLYSLCEQNDVDYDPRLPELEAEFYAAADMHAADVREEVELRTLRKRKMELGTAFFAPRVLRAIVAYNQALLRRIDEQVQSSQDWGVPPSEGAGGESVSVFETKALPKLAEALRRRAAGDPPAYDPVDRVAWCLDLGALTKFERDSLLSESTGRAEEVVGTTVLVGLLCRSAVVLDEEFPAVEIDEGQLTGAWRQQLGDALQKQVNARLAKQDYDGACGFSDLKSRFLTEASGETQHNQRMRDAARVPKPPRAPQPTPRVEESAREQAKKIAQEALESHERERQRPALRELPWRRLAGYGLAAAFATVALLLVNAVFFDAGRVAREELTKVSSFLTSGERSAEGIGSAFVGSVSEAWSQLDAHEQQAEAESLVTALRERGVREIMVYDGDDRLRIQALGDRVPRVISP